MDTSNYVKIITSLIKPTVLNSLYRRFLKSSADLSYLGSVMSSISEPAFKKARLLL